MIEVTCAVIRNDEGEVLVVQRGEKGDHPMKWEFPGGKIKSGESAEECIIREIEEELSLDIIIFGRLKSVEHDYGHKQIRLIPFVCDTLIDLPVLHEHKAFRWIETGELPSIDFSEADIGVAANYKSAYELLTDKGRNDRENGLVDISGMREILSGQISADACNLIAESAVENRDVLGALYKFSVSDETTLAFRSSWSLSKAAEIDSQVIEPYISDIVLSLAHLDNVAVIRSFLKILLGRDFNTLGEKEHGILASKCFEWLNTGTSAIALKAYSMEAMYKLTLIYPELQDELISTITRVMDGGSAGVKARGEVIIKKMRRDNLSR